MSNKTLCIPLETAKAIAALGVKCEGTYWLAYWETLKGPRFDILTQKGKEKLKKPNGGDFLLVQTYLLGELPAVLEAIGKVKGWSEDKYSVRFGNEHPTLATRYSGVAYPVNSWKYHWDEICRLYAKDPKKGWGYLITC